MEFAINRARQINLINLCLGKKNRIYMVAVVHITINLPEESNNGKQIQEGSL